MKVYGLDEKTLIEIRGEEPSPCGEALFYTVVVSSGEGYDLCGSLWFHPTFTSALARAAKAALRLGRGCL